MSQGVLGGMAGGVLFACAIFEFWVGGGGWEDISNIELSQSLDSGMAHSHLVAFYL